MRHTQRWIVMVGLLLLLGSATHAQAQDAAAGVFSGEFLIGYRAVDVSGAEPKYQQHLNLYDGMRLSRFHITYEPGDSARQLVDLVEVGITNFGGEPFETMNATVRKFGAYHFQYRLRKSTYAYTDKISETAFDPVTFDFKRRQDAASLKIWLGDAAHLSIGFDRTDKDGASTRDYRVSRERYELDKQVNEKRKEYNMALDYAFGKRVTVVLEEKIVDYKNTNSFFLPGLSLGFNLTDPSLLNYFFKDNPYDYTSYAHTAKVNARPTDRFNILAAATFQTLDLNMDYSRQSSGVSTTATPVNENLTGKGAVSRDIHLYDVDLSYLLNESLSLIGAVRYHDFKQDGDLVVKGQASVLQGKSKYDILGFEGGLQWQLSAAFIVSGGVLREARSVESAVNGAEFDGKEKTTLTGAFAHLKGRMSEAMDFSADYQLGSADDPYTLTSPTTRHRLHVRTKYQINPQISLTGSYLMHRTKNDTVDWTSDQDQVNLDVGYHKDNLDLSLGYGLLNIKQKVDQHIEGGEGATAVKFVLPILYEGKTNLFTGQARFDLNKQWALGGGFSYFDNTESEPVKQLDLRTYVEVAIAKNYLVNVGYRYVDYKEGDGLNDYKANIAEFSVGYRW